jgi:DNA-binding LacI/PurR family transcriptional regulator
MARQTATVRDIAVVAGVSPASVSRALRNPNSVSERTRTRVNIALDQIEAQRVRTPRATTPTIGCLFVDSTSGPRFSGFDATIWSGIARVAMNHSAEVLLLNVDRRERDETIADMVAQRGIGALAARIDARSNQLIDEIAEAGIPAVAVAHKHDHPDIGYICVTSRDTSKDAVSHLIHLGHTQWAIQDSNL